ncbi:MAG: 1-acyl-sn-glycerol-3-phosphate acyltransferase [Ignavibacteriae bacterium]|nr:1-acyl-sn-glycerol-3-phosphate acyltransferase [Ignavibacteriota bacterium]
MYKRLQFLFFFLIVRPVVLIILGMNIRYRNNLPLKGPAIIVANHNSHLDTIVLMSLFPFKLLPNIRPIAAMDYFLKNKILSWFALNIINIIPFKRKQLPDPSKIFEGILRSIDNNDIVILFPEGSRGKPEMLSHFKSGIAHLAKKCPNVPIVPIFLHGLGKALPKSDWVLVPFYCDIFIGKPLIWNGEKRMFMTDLENSIKNLANEGQFPVWE